MNAARAKQVQATRIAQYKRQDSNTRSQHSEQPMAAWVC